MGWRIDQGEFVLYKVNVFQVARDHTLDFALLCRHQSFLHKRNCLNIKRSKLGVG